VGHRLYIRQGFAILLKGKSAQIGEKKGPLSDMAQGSFLQTSGRRGGEKKGAGGRKTVDPMKMSKKNSGNRQGSAPCSKSGKSRKREWNLGKGGEG